MDRLLANRLTAEREGYIGQAAPLQPFNTDFVQNRPM